MSFRSPSLVSLRPWQSECQRRTLCPPHHHTLTPTGYPTMLFRTQYPSNIECDRHIQDWEHTQHLGTCGAPTYLQGVTQGEQVPAECLSRSAIMYKSKYIHGGTLPE